jgi:CDP-diacylglycerol--serine O-phosphatidyltransferase
MVSTLRYYSFKDLDLRRRPPYLTILILALLFVAIGTHPQVMCLGMAAAYLVSGPSLKIYSLSRRRHLVSPLEEPVTTGGSKELDG